ncbi:MAG: DUF4145 domain-containing protein [Eggerthellaceae bacterium]|nr:DUF4145 domain-containing protein [Eggerthellaceae bacterium]
MPKFIAPKRFLDVFTCPFCDITAEQKWYGNHNAHEIIDATNQAEPGGIQLSFYDASINEVPNWTFSVCEHCKMTAVWHGDEMVYPFSCPVDEPNGDMPDDIKSKYVEASKVLSVSPASAAALLRLALQIVLKQILGNDSTGKIYDDLKILKERSFNSRLIQACDIIRVNGNEAVHPGTINLEEKRDDALYLFTLLNMICDQFFSQPRRMDEMYEQIPENKRVITS